jgi:predicted membrane protein
VLRASFLGFFRSNNDLAKALAVFLLIHIVMMFSFNLPDYSVHYIVVWIAVSACFTPKIRNYNNEEIHHSMESCFIYGRSNA